MVDIPDDIMRTATEIVDRIAKYHTWKGDCVADVASALLAERQRTDAAKAMCDEMAKEARREALNEAEKVIREHPGITYTNHRGNTDWRLASRQDFIDTIRALSKSSPKAQEVWNG